MKKCKVDWCKSVVLARGYCSRHYYYWKRHGVPFTQSGLEQVAKYGKGCVNPDGYKMLSIDGKRVREHRMVMEQYLGRKLRLEEHIHHVNGNKLDNRIENLKIVNNVTHKQEHERKYETGEKQCSKCKKVKKLDCFKFRINSPKCSNRHRFYDSWCKQCCTDVRREWRHRIKGTVI